MLNQLINLAKQQLVPSLKEKENLNDHQVNDTFGVAKSSLFEGLKDQVLTGNLNNLTNLFNGKESNSSFLSKSVLNHFIPELASKLGISQSQASSIGNMVIPFLINKFSSKETGTVNNESDLLSKFGIDSENALGGLGSKLGGLFS